MRHDLTMYLVVVYLLLTGQAWGQIGNAITGFQSTVERGLAISPVPLDLRNESLLGRTLIGTGSYLVNAVGDCVSCHTTPTYVRGGNPFQGEPEQINVDGFLAGGGEFGPFIGRNITPDANGNPAGLTLQQFVEVMRTGVDLHDADYPTPRPSPLLRIMPWPEYKKLTDIDLRAIYEYLRRVPSKP